MTFHNRTGEAYIPLGQAGFDFLSQPAVETAPSEQDGLYFRGRTFPDLQAELRQCLSGEKPFQDLSIDAVQAQNEIGWKQPHGSMQAGDRFVNKAWEEQREVDEALEDWFEDRQNDQTTEHLLEELGDFNWCVTALASNAGAVVDSALKQRTYDYLAGTRQYIDGELVSTKWHGAAATVATKFEPLTIGDIDGLIEAGFMPRFSPAMNLYDDEPPGSATEYAFNYSFYAGLLQNHTRLLFDERNLLVGDDRDKLVAATGQIAAEVYFRTATMAHMAGSSLAEVIETNVRKTSWRVENNAVDKTDPNRRT